MASLELLAGLKIEFTNMMLPETGFLVALENNLPSIALVNYKKAVSFFSDFFYETFGHQP